MNNKNESKIQLELSEKDCVAVQHALLTVVAWNDREGDENLMKMHNDIRKQFIDVHEEYLND